MHESWKRVVWSQFGASIDMMENAIRACPDPLWSDPSRAPAPVPDGVVGFWYLAFHTLYFLDLYLSVSAGTFDNATFAPPPPFGRTEDDPDGLLPDRPYTRDELLGYLAHCRAKCRATIAAMSEADADAPCGLSRHMSRAELLLYNHRHVQHHTGQLNLLLRQGTASAAPRWVRRAADSL